MFIDKIDTGRKLLAFSVINDSNDSNKLQLIIEDNINIVNSDHINIYTISFEKLIILISENPDSFKRETWGHG